MQWWVLLCLFALTHAQTGIWKAGAASRTILPTVNGTIDYLQYISPEDCCSAGTFVKEFDVGTIRVGNGDGACNWVRDNLMARVATIGPDPDGKILVLVSVEVYMFFSNDLQEYYDMVKQSVGDTTYNNLLFFVHAQHNHEGPDTSGLSGPINHDYYTYMLQQMADATTEALNNMEDAYLFFGQDQFYFGLEDIRDPLMYDSSLRILRAYRNKERVGAPIFSMVNWPNHPEVTLNYSPTIDPSDCLQLNPFNPDCSAEGRYFTHDFPGDFSQILQTIQGGGEALYFNGAIGCQLVPGDNIWEISPEYPLGNGYPVPPGAPLIPENFRQSYVFGKALAEFAHQIQFQNPNTPLPLQSLNYKKLNFLIPMTNFLFRFGMVPMTAVFPNGDPTRPVALGNTLRKLYVCEGSNPTMDDCVFDNYEYNFDPTAQKDYRVGNWLETEISYAQVGPLKFIAVPGEIAPELSPGLPRDFDLPSSVSKYFLQPNYHAVGVNYTLPGVIMDMLPCSYEEPCWLLGLTNDEIGYMIPISDFRIKCTASQVECDSLWAQGATTYPQSSSGELCKNITENYSYYQNYYTTTFGADVWTKVNNTCVFGQADGEADVDHYEETNALSWDSAGNFFQALSQMMGVPISGRYCKDNCQSINHPSQT